MLELERDDAELEEDDDVPRNCAKCTTHIFHPQVMQKRVSHLNYCTFYVIGTSIEAWGVVIHFRGSTRNVFQIVINMPRSLPEREIERGGTEKFLSG